MKTALHFFLIFLLFTVIGYSNLFYLYEQGVGQSKLFLYSKENNDLLNDQTVSQEDKEKIKNIIKYKDYFYNYFETEADRIYSKTVFLEQDAVTYLVITSPKDQIKALESYFPLIGSFPYLGFFKRESALSYAIEKEEENFSTYIKPVYAYSTLGYFEDPILSSFFRFDDVGTAEIIFHELFHKLFFIDDNVELNEALAEYFSKELLKEYFKNHSIEKKLLYSHQKELLSLKIIELSQELNDLYAKEEKSSEIGYEQILDRFLKDSFYPQIERSCKELELSKENCFPLKQKWNNATFAAFLTYKKDSEKIAALHKNVGGSLKDLFHHLEKSYKSYKLQNQKLSFTEYLLSGI